MCTQCENCSNSKCSRGAQRGVMDCDPDEYWCSADNDYYYCEDSEIEAELRAEYIAEQIANGVSQEEAEEMAEEIEFEVDCPDYDYYDYYDESDDNADYYYDLMKDRELYNED